MLLSMAWLRACPNTEYSTAQRPHQVDQLQRKLSPKQQHRPRPQRRPHAPGAPHCRGGSWAGCAPCTASTACGSATPAPNNWPCRRAHAARVTPGRSCSPPPLTREQGFSASSRRLPRRLTRPYAKQQQGRHGQNHSQADGGDDRVDGHQAVKLDELLCSGEEETKESETKEKRVCRKAIGRW